MLPIQREISEGFRPPMLIQKMHIKPLLNTKLICHNLIRFDMAHYIDADKLISEIERKRDSALERQKNLEKIGQETVLNEMIAAELNRLISFVTSLQQEQPEADLEKEIETYFKGWYMDETDQGYILHTPDDHAGLMSVKQVARHFAEWGRKQVLQELYKGKIKPFDKIAAVWLDDEQNT